MNKTDQEKAITEEGDKKDGKSFLIARDPSVDRMYRPRPVNQRNLCKTLEEDVENDSEVIEIMNSDDSDDNNSNGDTVISSSTTTTQSSDPHPSSHSEITTTTDSMNAANSDSALIFLRIKPVPVSKISSLYKVSDNVLITSHNQPSTDTIGKSVEKHFVFTSILDQNVDQKKVYETCVREKIRNEENFTVLTYGTSGSGKTYTLLGDVINPGIIPRSLEDIFAMYADYIYPKPVAKLRKAQINIENDEQIIKSEQLRKELLSMDANVSQSHKNIQNSIKIIGSTTSPPTGNQSIFIWISFIEIYNEIISDLLSPNDNLKMKKKENLKIICNDGQVFISNLTSVYVKSSYEAYKLLTIGLNKAKYASTSVNNNSSRSHCVFIVDIITYISPNTFTQHCYKFCDLAGSERLAKTKNVGNRLKEAQHINMSLMVLGRCLAVATSNQHKKNGDVIPYRESKLTTLLQAALNGKEKLCLVANITPVNDYYEENLHVLDFTSIAKNIVCKDLLKKKSNSVRYSFFPSLPRDSSSDPTKSEAFRKLYEENISLKSEIEHLKDRIEELEGKLNQQESELRKELVSNFQQRRKENDKLWEKRLELKEVNIGKVYEAKIAGIESRYKRKIENLMEEINELKMELNKVNEPETTENENSKRRRTADP